MALVFPNVRIDTDLLGSRTVVRVATTAAGTLASSFENGDTVDGVVLATGDRILIKDQASGSENGIYVVEATGAPTRASDMPTGDSANCIWTWVQEGTINANTAYVCTSAPGSDLVGTDALTFSQYDVTGTLPISRGGTGTTSLTPGNRVVQTNASATALETTTTPQLTEIQDTNGNELIIFTATAAAVNEFTITNAATGNAPTLQSSGDANTGFILADSNSNNLLVFNSTASAVNSFEMTNTATGNAPIFAAAGEANTGMIINDSNGNELLTLDSVASAVNDVTISNAATGNAPEIRASGEANTGLILADSNSNEILILDSVASAVNEVSITNADTGNSPIIASLGETNVNLEFNTAGTGAFVFGAGGASTSAEIRLEDNSGGEYGAIRVPDTITTSYTYILPDGVGTSGQFLTTDGNNPAQLTWSSSSSATKYVTILSLEAETKNTTAQAVAYFPWDDSEYSAFTTNTLIFWHSATGNRSLVVELYDETNAASLGTTTIAASTSAAIATFTWTDPSSDALVSLRISKGANGGNKPSIFGATLKFE